MKAAVMKPANFLNPRRSRLVKGRREKRGTWNLLRRGQEWTGN
jgi:hypothetical protein